MKSQALVLTIAAIVAFLGGPPFVTAADARERVPPAETADARDSVPPAEAADARERVPPAETADARDSVPPAETADARERVPPAETADARERVPPAEAVDARDSVPPAETADARERVPPAETADARDSVPPAETADVGKPPALQWHCGPNARIEGNLLIVDVPVGEEKTGGLATANLDITAWDGKPIGASIVASGERIAKPLHWYTGLKFQFEYEDPLSGEWSYPNTPSRLGDFPKQTIRVADLVAGTTRAKARMMIGLQETSGHAVFDLSTLRIGDPVPLWPITNQNYVARYSAALAPNSGAMTSAAKNAANDGGTSCQMTNGLPQIAADGGLSFPPSAGTSLSSQTTSSLPQSGFVTAVQGRKPLRGVMSPSQAMTLDDFDTLQAWGATLIRYQMGRNWNAQKVTPDLGEYDRWLKTKLDHFDSFVLPEAVKRGMKVVLDMHEAPGMKNEFNEWNMLHDPAVARHFVETWRRIARRFKGRAGIYGYDLWNEPMQTGETAPECDFWTLQKRAAEAIREIDAEIPIIVECNGQDSPWAYGCFSPLDLTNIIYQVHMYLPLAYTHQGVMWKQGDSYRPYPDESKGWNKNYLRAGLRPVREFQLRHGAKIYCGEFSAVAWAPGADQYLRDCIDLFEEYGWDWSYHAFREWEGWSVEYEGPNGGGLVPAADTPRKRALIEGLQRP